MSTHLTLISSILHAPQHSFDQCTILSNDGLPVRKCSAAYLQSISSFAFKKQTCFTTYYCCLTQSTLHSQFLPTTLTARSLTIVRKQYLPNDTLSTSGSSEIFNTGILSVFILFVLTYKFRRRSAIKPNNRF